MTDKEIQQQLADGASHRDLRKQGVGGGRIKRIRNNMPPDSLPTPKVNGCDSKSDEKPSLKVVETENYVDIASVSENIKTVEDVLAKAQIDLKLWRVVETSINSWEVAGKLKQGQDEAGKWKPEGLWKNSLWQIRVKLQRKAPKGVQEGIKELLADLKPRKWKPIKRAENRDLLVELSLLDAHFGKLAWAAETGEDNYDLRIAEEVYINAAHDLLARVENDPIAKIVLPLGSDFFHVDSWLGTTTKGTLVDSSDDRFQKVFKVGCQAVRHLIEYCRNIAEVECLWIPGNHDTATSWYMCQYLSAWFREDKHVTFDNSPLARKYLRFGNNLLAYTHGDQPALAKLPLLMAVESPADFGATKYRAWRVGHFHKKAQTSHTAGDTHNGVKIDVMPSLSATDRWHFDHGFVRNARAAEIWLWDREEGYVGHFSANARVGREEVE